MLTETDISAPDREAFTPLMQRHEGPVRRLCGKFTWCPDDVDDLVLETFVVAYQKLDQLRDPDAFGGWVRQIALNVCRSWYRGHRAEPVALTFDPPVQEDEDAWDNRIPLGMDRLSAPHRQVLDLHYRAGLTYQEIADELAVPIGTVMSRMHRARAALRDVVETVEDGTMEEESNLEQRFRMEIELLDALHAEAEAADGIVKVKADSEPVVRLRQVLETQPSRLLDLLQLSDTDERLRHLAGVARSCIHAAIPVLASAALSDDPTLSERATRMAEHWITLVSHTRHRGTYLFLDALIASPASEDRKVALLVRLIQRVKEEGLFNDGHHVMFALTGVVLGYPEAAFPRLWDALWEIEEDDLKEYGVRKAIGHLVEPFTDAALEVVRSGDRDRILRLLGHIRPIFSSRSPLGAYMPNPKRLYRGMRVLLDSDDAEIVKKARSIGVGHQRVSVDQFMARTTDPDPSVRSKAARALGARAAASAKDRLLELIQEDDDFEVRKAAVQAYGRVAGHVERQVCLAEITKSGDRKLMKVAARALYTGSGPRERTALEEKRIQRIRGDAKPNKHIDPLLGVKSLPEIRDYEEEELTQHVARVCSDYSTTRRQMVMEGRHALMVREKGVYKFTQIGEAVWRVGQFIEAAKQRIGTSVREDGHIQMGPAETDNEEQS